MNIFITEIHDFVEYNKVSALKYVLNISKKVNR